MGVFAISDSTIKNISRWDQSDLDIVLVSGYAENLQKIFQRSFEPGQETVLPLLSENKYAIFYWGQLGDDNLLITSKPRKLNNKVCFFMFKVCVLRLYLNHLQRVYENQFFFLPRIKKISKNESLKKVETEI